MAREDGKGKDGENYEFIPPDFDEDQFIHREMVSFKTTLILFLWGIVAALASWGAFAAVEGARRGWFIGLAICLAFFLALRPIFGRLKADIKHWGRREWLGTALLFFFTWLAIFIVAVNPPISDYAEPRVTILASPAAQQAGGQVAVDIFFEDNHRIDEHTFRLSQGGLEQAAEGDLVSLGHGHYRYVISNAVAGVYEVTASATDPKGNVEHANATFAVVETGLRLFLPTNATLDETGQVIAKVETSALPACVSRKGSIRNEPCIRSVYLTTTTGGKVTMSYSKEDGRWEASANYLGWSPGENTFNATADVVGDWVGYTFVDGGELTSGPHTLTVTATPGDFVPKVLREPSPTARNVPGIGPVVLVAGLVVLAALVRRGK